MSRPKFENCGDNIDKNFRKVKKILRINDYFYCYFSKYIDILRNFWRNNEKCFIKRRKKLKKAFLKLENNKVIVFNGVRFDCLMLVDISNPLS